MDKQHSLRNLLLEQLGGQQAHVDFNRAVKGLDIETTGLLPDGFSLTLWELVEQIRITSARSCSFVKY